MDINSLVCPSPVSQSSHSKLQNVSHLLMGFWNVEGIYKLFNLDVDLCSYLSKFQILGFSETWHTSSVPNLPSYFTKYSIFSSQATKTQVYGRPSGGLILAISKDLNATIFNVTHSWIFIKLHYENCVYIVGLVYFKPYTESYKLQLVDFEEILNKITEL